MSYAEKTENFLKLREKHRKHSRLSQKEKTRLTDLEKELRAAGLNTENTSENLMRSAKVIDNYKTVRLFIDYCKQPRTAKTERALAGIRKRLINAEILNPEYNELGKLLSTFERASANSAKKAELAARRWKSRPRANMRRKPIRHLTACHPC